MNYKIICDIQGCGKIASFCINADNTIDNSGFNICKDCAKKLQKELSNCLKGEDNAQKK